MKGWPKLSKQQIAAIKDAWVNGIDGEAVTRLDLAIEYDVTPPAITYHVKGLVRNIKPPMGRKRGFDYAKAIRLKGQGLTGYVIGERLGVSAVSVYRVVKYGDNIGRTEHRMGVI